MTAHGLKIKIYCLDRWERETQEWRLRERRWETMREGEEGEKVRERKRDRVRWRDGKREMEREGEEEERERETERD